MLDFTFHNATKIIFGRDTEKKVGEEISKLARKSSFTMVEAA